MAKWTTRFLVISIVASLASILIVTRVIDLKKDPGEGSGEITEPLFQEPPGAVVPEKDDGPAASVEPGPPLEEADPEPTWFEHWVEGTKVYEGAIPYEDLPPINEPIEKRANPELANVATLATSWLSVSVEPLAHDSMVTYGDLNSALGWDDLYLVDGRFAIGVRYSPKEGITPEVRSLIDQYADGHAMLSNVLHRTKYELGDEYFESAFSAPRVAELDNDNRRIRKELMMNHGVRIGATTLPVSDEALRKLEG